MNILVIGGGSMGRRRLRDLTYLNPGRVMVFEPVSERCEQVSASFGISGFTDLDLALQQRPEALVVSTPPALHETYVGEVSIVGCTYLLKFPLCSITLLSNNSQPRRQHPVTTACSA
jgi:pyrroline-5-carboxylate reductase